MATNEVVIKHKPLPEVSVVTNPTWSASSVTVAGNKKQGISDIQLNMPQGICVDQHGNLYVADRDNHRIQRFEPDSVIGETIAGENNGFGLASNHLYHPADIFVDSAGNLFVADQSNNRIQKFSRNSKQGITVAKCTSPRAIFVTKHGDLYVSEFDKVMKYSLSNSTLETVVAENLEDARGIFVVEGKLDNDSLYVADRAHHCIQKFVLGSNMKGVIVAGVKGEQGLDANYLNFPNDVILDSFGNLYIADHGNHRIQRVNVQDGTTETIAGVTGRKSKSDHHLAYPKSLAFDSKLNLYVSDTYNRVQKFAIEVITTSDEIINNKPIEDISLYTMQLKSVSYESSLWPDLFNRLTTSEIEENEKPKMVTVIHPDGKSINYLWKKTQIYEQFRKLFNEKRYSFEKFIPVDKHQIGLDLTNNNQSLLHPFLLEYSILEKTSLIQIKIKYEEKINDYFTTLECPFINIFDRCLNYSNLNLISNEDKVFCFFDENRRWIYDGTVEEQKKKEIYITLTEIDRSTSINEICYRTEQNKQNNFNIDSQMNLIVLDEEKKVLFHPDTTWKNLDKWFRQQSMGKNLKKDLFSYYLKEKRIVVSENELIFSSHELITIDVINQDSTMNVKISYEDQSKEICVLKGMKVNQLLNNEYLLLQLNLNGTSFQDYVLAFGENNHQIISKEDTHKSISEFFVDDEHIVEFRIGILIQIFTSNHEEKPQEIPLFTRKISIEELFQICKGSERRFKHIASYKTKKILAICQLLTDIDETRFLLLEEDQICSIQIQRSPDNQLIKIDDYSTITQDFASVATIADIYKVNQTAIQNEFLLFENDFLLSMETSLSVLKSTSTIQFNVKNEKLPIHIYVENSVNKQTIDYYSSLTISIHRLCFVACQLMLLNPIFYQLMHDEKKLSDGEMCLKNLEAISNEVKFKLICIASIEVSIKYQQVTILIPCTMQTLISDLIKETLLKLNIPNNDLSMFELVALGNQRTQVEFDYTIDDIHQELFPENTKTLPFELETKNSE